MFGQGNDVAACEMPSVGKPQVQWTQLLMELGHG